MQNRPIGSVWLYSNVRHYIFFRIRVFIVYFYVRIEGIFKNRLTVMYCVIFVNIADERCSLALLMDNLVPLEYLNNRSCAFIV